MAGADPVPPPPAAPAPAVVYYVNGNQGDCCGKASVCGDDDCCFKKSKCCLFQKIKDKLCCWKKCCEKSNDCCGSKNDCGNKNACTACQQPQVVYVVKQDAC